MAQRNTREAHKQKEKQRQKQKQKTLKQKGGNLTPWLKEVKAAHRELKQKNPDTPLGDAMKLASKRRKTQRK